MINHKRQHGFTVIELTLVMASMSILLLAVLYATLHAGALYDKGITNRTINQMSRDVGDMIRRDFASVDPTMVKFVQTGTSPNFSGRLCLGTVSYLWNTAPVLTAHSGGIVDPSNKQINFIRVSDVGQFYCLLAGGVYPNPTAAAISTATDILSGSGTRDYAPYSLSYTQLAVTAPQGLFEIKMTLGTNSPSTTQSVAGSMQCKPPTDTSSDFNYCSVTDLDIIVRSGGKT